MPIQIKIEDSDAAGFTEPAKDRLRKAAEDYVSSLIAEANRIEAGRNLQDSPTEVTQAMVTDAVFVLRRGLGSSKSTPATKIVRGASAVLSSIVGWLYDPHELVDRTHFVVFVALLALAILTTTISIIKE
jgi:hypothetical protein